MKEPIESFLNYIAVEKGYSDHTIAAYRNDLTAMADYAQKEVGATSWVGFSRQNMLAYLLHMKERGYVPTTIARKVAAARSFFSFLVSEGTIKNNPTENISSPSVGKDLP